MGMRDLGYSIKVTTPSGIGIGVLVWVAEEMIEHPPIWVMWAAIIIAALLLAWSAWWIADAVFKRMRWFGELPDELPGEVVQSDSWLADAIWRIHLRKWQSHANAQADFADQDDAFWERLSDTFHEKVRQYLFDGKIPVWGKPKNSTLWKPIPKEFWENHAPDWFNFVQKEPSDLNTLVFGFGDSEGEYRALRTNKASVEALCRAENI